MTKNILDRVTGFTKRLPSNVNPVVYVITFPLEIYYTVVKQIDNKLFNGNANLLRLLDLFWVVLILYLLWFRLSN